MGFRFTIIVWVSLRCISPTSAAAHSIRSLQSCPSRSYAFQGSPACSTCPPGTTFVSSSQTCAPSAATGPADTVFYLSGSASEGVGAFSSPAPTGLTFVADRGGNAGEALAFAGAAHLSTPPAAALALPSGASARSVAFWITCPQTCPGYPTAPFSYGATSTHSLFRIHIWNNPCGKVYVVLYNDDLDSNAAPYASVCDGSWHHVAVTFDSTTLIIYVDGDEEASRDASYMTTAADTQLHIGWTGTQGECSSTGCQFAGGLDDVRVYSRALSPTEVVELTRNTSAVLSCPSRSYSFSGSPACSTCPPGTTFVSASQTCSPSAATGPADTVFYLSGSASEGVGAFSSPAPMGLTFVADRGGNAGEALAFAGAAHLSAPLTAALAIPSGASARSVAFWITCPLTCPGYSASVFSYGATNVHSLFRISIGNSPCGKMWVELYNDNLDTNAVPYASVCDGSWHHVSVTFDGTSLVIYVDGDAKASRGAAYMTTASGTQLHLGWTGAQGDCYSTGCQFAGGLDDVRVYNRALAATEVFLLYNTSAPIPTPSQTPSATSTPSLSPSITPSNSATPSITPSPSATVVTQSLTPSASPSRVPCAAGSWPLPGSSGICVFCSPGTFAVAGAAFCSLCPAGSYGDRAGLSTPSCSGNCSTAACPSGSSSCTAATLCPAGSVTPPSTLAAMTSSPMTCSAADATAIPTSLGLQILPAAHPQNSHHEDLIIAPAAVCALLSPDRVCNTTAANTVVGSDGVSRFVVGTAASLNMETADTFSCL